MPCTMTIRLGSWAVVVQRRWKTPPSDQLGVLQPAKCLRQTPPVIPQELQRSGLRVQVPAAAGLPPLHPRLRGVLSEEIKWAARWSSPIIRCLPGCSRKNAKACSLCTSLQSGNAPMLAVTVVQIVRVFGCSSCARERAYLMMNVRRASIGSTCGARRMPAWPALKPERTFSFSGCFFPLPPPPFSIFYVSSREGFLKIKGHVSVWALLSPAPYLRRCFPITRWLP